MPKIPGTKPNYFYSVTSVTLVLFLLGVFGLLVLQGQQMVKYFKEQVEIIVEMKDEISNESLDSLKQMLAYSQFCKANSVRFISKEDGAAMMQEEFGQDFLKLDMANPLYDVMTFNVNADYMEPDSLAEIRLAIKELPAVNDVYYQESVTDAITSNLNKISVVVLAAGLFFIIVAVALILNTIRLALYSNRFLIKNMELVGASWDFISRPYIWRSFRHGLLSAFLACGVLAFLLFFVFNDSPEMQEMLFLPGIIVIFGALLISGIVISVASTWYVVKKYLKMRVDDLY